MKVVTICKNLEIKCTKSDLAVVPRLSGNSKIWSLEEEREGWKVRFHLRNFPKLQEGTGWEQAQQEILEEKSGDLDGRVWKRAKETEGAELKLTVRAGGIAQRLGGLAALTEDPVAIPSSQMAGVQHPLLTPQALGTYMLHMRGTKINKYLFFLKASQSGQVRSFCRCWNQDQFSF